MNEIDAQNYLLVLVGFTLQSAATLTIAVTSRTKTFGIANYFLWPFQSMDTLKLG